MRTSRHAGVCPVHLPFGWKTTHGPVTPELDADAGFRRTFVRRRRVVLASLVGWVATLWIAIRFDVPAALPVLFLAFFVVLAARIVMWRCPRCGTGFGRSIIVRRCRNCSLPLDAGGGRP